jgi:hypothetical protein
VLLMPHTFSIDAPLKRETLPEFSASTEVLNRLKRASRALRVREPDSMFLSHAWFDACTELWQDRAPFDVLELEGHAQEPVWALIGRKLEWRHRMLPVKVIALNQSCNPVLDQPWIEHNGLFGEPPAAFERSLPNLLDELLADPDWDEFRLPGLRAEHARQALYEAARLGLIARLDLEQPSFSIDLNHIRSNFGGDYLRALSANTRQQLRRARRLAEQSLGSLKIEEAQDASEAIAWFADTAPFHRARWGQTNSTTMNSGFDNPEFVRFHQLLITKGFESRSIQYLKCSAGETTLAYLYNFVSGPRTHFYLSGVNYSVDSAIKPGMLAHWLAVERNLEANRELYDFLAGDARYKRSLSTNEDRTLWLVLRRPRLKLEMENRARRLKRRLFSQQIDSLGSVGIRCRPNG